MRLSLQRKNPIKVAPYEKLSEIYDFVMRHVDYRLWGGYIYDLVHSWHPQARLILDVGCGTGSLLHELSRYDYQLWGCDRSLAMLRRAKAKKALTKVPLWCSGMSDFAVRHKADVILCLYDSINYILEPGHVVDFMTTAARGLNRGGLLIFDICTERNSLKYFFNYHDHAEQDQFSFDRWSHYDSDKKIQHTEFKLRFKSDPNTYLEAHQQRIYSIRKLVQLIKDTPFVVLEVFDEFTFKAANSKSNRLHFLLQLGANEC